MPQFQGQLYQNEVIAALYNMIISQQVFADNIRGTYSELVDKARVDGGLYGDQKLYIATDVLKSYDWLNDAEAKNLLQLHRPTPPKTQSIVLNIFRQCAITIDNYMTKRAFSDEYTFSMFNSTLLGWIRDTKRVYDATTYNSYVGTTESTIGKQQLEIDIPSVVGTATGEEAARLEGAAIAEFISLLLVNLKDVTRDYNDYKFLRSLSSEDIQFIWNADAIARVSKRDLPTIYHKDIVDRFGENVLPGRYFGKPTAASVQTSDGSTIRILEEADIEVSGINEHFFPGDLLPAGITISDGTNISIPTYTQDPTILFKVTHRRSIPFMSAFEVGTSFYNPRSLTETNYLTWGRNTLEYLKNYPMITVRAKANT